MVMEWLTSWEKKGLEQGRQESKEEIATKMLAKGLDPAIVEEMTGLPAGRIRELSSRLEVDKVT
ncbi:putative transposase/invertase (TIGR01784 family) [Cohnella phaseoli]|uniref:Putative transposase/invertase (TIGR01784 family) n=2 Tax=Cohnella phaseoli TaxID=456490 RepID=A0A3D9KBU9_9BACL|nr:putative transposase/invertase (TIGR01784 family) [Cohnella phaseoli]